MFPQLDRDWRFAEYRQGNASDRFEITSDYTVSDRAFHGCDPVPAAKPHLRLAESNMPCHYNMKGAKMEKTIKISVILMLVLALFRIIASIQMIIAAEKTLDSGVLFILNAIAIIGITLGAYNKGEKWSWWTLLIIVMTPPIYCIIAHGWLAWNIVGLVLSTLPIIIPAKSILSPEIV